MAKVEKVLKWKSTFYGSITTNYMNSKKLKPESSYKLVLLVAERIQTFVGAYETYLFISIVIYFGPDTLGLIADSTMEPADAG